MTGLQGGAGCPMEVLREMVQNHRQIAAQGAGGRGDMRRYGGRERAQGGVT